MNIRVTKKLYLVLFVLTLLVSCSDELNVKSTSVITNSSFWQSEDDVNGALNGMYFQLRSAAAMNLYLLGEARSEILTYGTVGQGGYDIYYFNSLTSANAGPGWQQFYTIVNTANLILKYSSSISFKSESSRNKILAQAYATRAFVYFVMTRTWGDLIIHTDPIESSSAEITQKERSSQTEVFKLIKEDLDNAIKLFPDNTFTTGRCFWSKPAAYALMAEVYLWTGKRLNGGTADFNQALSALNEVKKADLTLLPGFADVFSYANKGNKEIVMSVKFQELEVGDNYFWIMWLIGSSIPATIDDYTRSIIYPVGGGQGIVVPSELFRKQYSEDDTRKKATFHEIYEYKTPEVGTYNTSIVLKGSGLVKGGTRYFLNDVILYRYSDVLLMIAEAKNALGQDPSAEINLVRARAYGNKYTNHVYVNDSKENNDAAILKERLLELAFEGKRWWDLIRFNKAFDLVPSLQDKKGKDYMMLYPIANSVLSLEPKVVQNPGWE